MSPELELQLSKKNVQDFTPKVLDFSKFTAHPFIPSSLRVAKRVYIRDDSFWKTPLYPRYSGPHEVIEKKWDHNTFLVKINDKTHSISINILKPAYII